MGKKFTNLNPVPLFGDYTDPFGDRRGSGAVRPEKPLQAAAPNFLGLDDDRLHFAWLGHSSVFLKIQRNTVLIDPVFCRFTSPVPFAGPKRFPGSLPKPSDFPAIDLLLITHNHYDHLDSAAIRALDGQVKHCVVPSGVGKYLRRFGVKAEKITELGWYETWEGNHLTVTAAPTQHGSARTPFDRDQTLWCSFVLKSRDYTVFDTGDGGFGDHFADIRKRYGSPDLAVMECGQYNRRWHSVHMFPEESAKAARILGAKLAVPVHWGAYVLSDHPWDDPPKRFSLRAEELGVPFRIPVLNEIITL